MRVALCTFIFLLLCSNTLAIGIGVSPEKLAVGPGEKRFLWLTNPNSYEITASVKSDCPDLRIEDSTLSIGSHETLSTVISADSKTEGCESSLVISILEPSNGNLGLVPTIVVPVHVSSNTQTYQVYRTVPGWDAKPQPSKVRGLSVTGAVVFVGLFAYLGLNGNLKRVLSSLRY